MKVWIVSIFIFTDREGMEYSENYSQVWCNQQGAEEYLINFLRDCAIEPKLKSAVMHLLDNNNLEEAIEFICAYSHSDAGCTRLQVEISETELMGNPFT